MNGRNQSFTLFWGKLGPQTADCGPLWIPTLYVDCVHIAM